MLLPVSQGKSLALFVGPGGRFGFRLGLGGLLLKATGLGLTENRVHLCGCCCSCCGLCLGWRAAWAPPQLSGSEFIFCLRRRHCFRAIVALNAGGLVGAPRLAVLGHRLELLERGMLWHALQHV